METPSPPPPKKKSMNYNPKKQRNCVKCSMTFQRKKTSKLQVCFKFSNGGGGGGRCIPQRAFKMKGVPGNSSDKKQQWEGTSSCSSSFPH